MLLHQAPPLGRYGLLSNFGTLWHVHGRALQTRTEKIQETHDSRLSNVAVELVRERLEEVSFTAYFVKTERKSAWIDRVLMKVRFLSEQGISTAGIQQITHNPYSALRLGSISTVKLGALISYLRSLDFQEPTVAHLLSKSRRIWYLDIEGVLKPRIEILQNIGLKGKLLQKFILDESSLLLEGDVNHLREILAILERVPLDKPSMCRVIMSCPSLLYLSIEQTLKPRIEILKGFMREHLHIALVRNPVLLKRNLDIIRKKVELLEEFGMERNSKPFARALGHLVNHSSEHLRVRFNFLVTLGFSRDDVCKIVRRMPSVLVGKEEVTVEKVAYFTNVMNRPLRDIVAWPTYLGYSFAKRIRPRFQAYTLWKAQNRAEDCCLSHIFSCADDVFRRRFKGKGCELQASKVQ